MRNMLVPVNPEGRMSPVLEAARLLAGPFGSYIEGVALGPDLPDVFAAEFVVTPPTLDPEAQRSFVLRSQQAFEQFMAAVGMPRHSGNPDAASHGWAGQQLMNDMQFGSYGRLFDLIVLGRPNAAEDPTRMATVEAALYETGRPVLLVPPSRATTIGRSVVIAWNGSTETARTVALAMPVLRRADRVIVLTIEGWDVDGPSGDGLARSLQRSGVAAEAMTRDMTSSSGKAVLEHAQTLGADLLIKGAYTQSRLRQMIFGGATRYIISNANLPVLIAH